MRCRSRMQGLFDGTGRRFSIADHHPGSERLPLKPLLENGSSTNRPSPRDRTFTRFVSVRYPGDEKICLKDWTRNFDPCAFMELATPDFCATGRQWVLLLATTLRQRDEAIRQRDEACQEAEASRWKEINSRRHATFWKTQHGRARARAEAARNELKRMKSASSANELGVGHARACEDEEATRRGRTRQRSWRATASLESSVARASGANARGKAARNERPSGVGGGSPGRRTYAALPGRGHLGNAAACGKPYARNGEKVTEFVEVDVRAYKRRCRRPRYRSTCSCAPKREVVAPPVPRLFANTPYGLSVWNWYRDLRPSPSVAVGTATVVDARRRAGHAGRQRQALRSLALGDCRAQRLALPCNHK